MQALLYSPFPDEQSILHTVLSQAGYAVRIALDLVQPIKNWPEFPADLLLVCIPNNEVDPGKIIRAFRAQSLVNFIVIIENEAEDLMIHLYEEGADYVVARPYSARLLLVKIRALARRTAGVPFFSLPIIAASGLELDPAARVIINENGEYIHLTQLEFRMIYTLMTHAGQIIPTNNIVEHVWGYSGEGNRDLVRGLVKRLRSKIESDTGNPKYIITEPGIGYYFPRA
ncbi:MAG: response regulator transcription factor [Anaerolineaceae bacterium]|nr:response regulator transcription factor [Anaerolineaceae bacterium]